MYTMPILAESNFHTTVHINNIHWQICYVCSVSHYKYWLRLSRCSICDDDLTTIAISCQHFLNSSQLQMSAVHNFACTQTMPPIIGSAEVPALSCCPGHGLRGGSHNHVRDRAGVRYDRAQTLQHLTSTQLTSAMPMHKQQATLLQP
jgi:hypothetical protein